MTPYDVAMLAVVVAGMVWGFWRGMIWQVASLGSLILGYTAAHLLSAQVAPHLPGPPVVARGLAMLVIYAAVAGGIFLAAWLARETLRQLKFEAYDRHMGLVLGGLEGGMLGVVATLFVTSLAPNTRAPVFASPTGKVVSRLLDEVGPVLPTEIRTALTPYWGNGGATGDPQEQVSLTQATRRRADRGPDPDADTDTSEPAPRRTFADTAEPAARRTAADPVAPGQTVGDLVRKAERRVGKAVADEAKRQLRDMVDNGDDRDVERR